MNELRDKCEEDKVGLGFGLLGFEVDFAKNPDDPGECAFLAFAQHAP